LAICGGIGRINRVNSKICWAAAVLLFTRLDLKAQETAAQRHQMATNHLKRIATEMSARCLTDIQSKAQWDKERPLLQRQLREMLGLEPLPKRTPLRPKITGRFERPQYSVEKIVFQSLPGLYVTGNFYVPKDAAQPFPTILYLCGHAPHPLGAKTYYQDRAAAFAKEGFACLILDTLEFGEVPGIHHGTHDLNMWHWLSLGYTPAGIEVWNAIRAMDYLETRSEVDASRIGLTGTSGGGATTWYTAAADERVAAAAPVCSTFTFGSQATNWRAAGQCDCIYFHNTFQLDFPVVGALIAPRPLLMISGRKDLDFPPDGYHEVFQRSKRIFDFYALGNSDRVRELEDDVGHSDTPQFQRAAREWMRKWLQRNPGTLNSQTNPPVLEESERLACLTELPADAINYKIHDLFNRPAVMKRPSSRHDWKRRRTALLTELNEKVFRWFPEEKIPFETKVLGNTGGWTGRYAEYKDVSLQTEAGVRVRVQVLKAKNRASDAPLLLYPKRAGDSIYFMDFDELLPVLGRYTVVILYPRFTEDAISASEYRNIAMTAAFTGRTIAGMQLWDILRALEWITTEEQLIPSSISLYGKGEMGILALYAALLDARVTEVILNDPPASHWEGPALLNVLRVTEIPEVAGALAPRRLTFLHRLPEGFDHTQGIYRLQGASDQFVQSGSLPEALQIWRFSNRAAGSQQRSQP
jgi:dienelactone hydrolase